MKRRSGVMLMCIMFMVGACGLVKPKYEWQIGYYIHKTEKDSAFYISLKYIDCLCYPNTTLNIEFKEYYVKITDRWHKTYFESKNPKEVWICKNSKLNEFKPGTYICHYDYVKANDTARHQALEHILIQRIRK